MEGKTSHCLFLPDHLKGKAKLEDLIRGNIIKQRNVKFSDEYVAPDKADIEDLFEEQEYIDFFNEAFTDEFTVDAATLDRTHHTILGRVSKAIKKPHFNHYRPAKHLAAKGVDMGCFSTATLDRFEKVFKDVNKLF